MQNTSQTQARFSQVESRQSTEAEVAAMRRLAGKPTGLDRQASLEWDLAHMGLLGASKGRKRHARYGR